MTKQEQALADDKMRAEIANLNVLAQKMAAETAKINAETLKISRERFVIPFTIFAGVVVAAATAVARFI